MRRACHGLGFSVRSALAWSSLALSNRSSARHWAARLPAGTSRERFRRVRSRRLQDFWSNFAARRRAFSRSFGSLDSNAACKCARTGSVSGASFFTHSFITCASRSAPSPRKSLRATLRMAGQAASGSTSSITAATDRQRRMATRRSWTASASGDERTLSSSLMTRSIQKERPWCSWWEPEGMAVTVAILRILVVCLRMSLEGTPVEGWLEYLVGGGGVQWGGCGKIRGQASQEDPRKELYRRGIESSRDPC